MQAAGTLEDSCTETHSPQPATTRPEQTVEPLPSIPPPLFKRPRHELLVQDSADPAPISGRKLAKKRAKRNSRRGQNFKRALALAFGDQEASSRARQKAISQGGVIRVDFDANNLSAARGGWVGLKGRFSGEKRAYTLEELLTGDPLTKRPAMTLFQWRDR